MTRPGIKRKKHLLLIIGLITSAFLIDGVYAFFTIQSSLQRARSALSSANDDLIRGDTAAAARQLRLALQHAEDAEDALLHPGFLLGRYLPWVGSFAEANVRLLDAAHAFHRSGSSAVEAARSIGLSRDGISDTTYSGGTFDLETLEAAHQHLTHAEHSFEKGLTELASARREGPDAIAERLQNSHESARRQLIRLRKTTSFLRALPEILGAVERRRYLLVFQALGESRGTGGVAGLYGILEADGGEVRLAHVGSYGELQRGQFEPVEAPAWFERNYGPQASTTQWAQANLSPNFPVVAGVMQKMYARAFGDEVDGLIALDPITLQLMLRGLGEVVVDDYDTSITSTNAARVLMVDSYTRFSSRAAQNRFLSGVVAGFWRALSSGRFDGNRLVSAIDRAVDGGHLKLWLARPKEQEVIRALEAQGDPTAWGENLQMVWSNNYSSNKVDYFMRRAIDTEVRPLDEETVSVTTEMSLHNLAPESGPEALLGQPIAGHPAGTARMTLNFLLPADATIKELAVDADERNLTLYQDSGREVVWTELIIPPGEETVVGVGYEFPREERGRLEFVLFPQTSPRPDRYSIMFRDSAQEEIVSASALPVSSAGASQRGYLTSPLKVTLEYRRR